jgi:predicted dehydrogenase
MVNLCRAKGIRLILNHGRRFDPVLRVEAARMSRIVGTPRTAVGWYSGGLREGGTHMIDLMRMLLGDMKVLGAGGGDALIRFDSGATGWLGGHDLADHALFELVVTGREGRMIVGRAGLDIRWERATEGYPLASGYRQLAPNGGWWDLEPRSFLGAMAEHVVAVLDGREQPLSTGEDGVAALKVIEAIEAAG